MSRQTPRFEAGTVPPDARIAVVAAKFNQKLVDELLSGCLKRLEALGIAKQRVEVHRVPGSFELPLAAKALARTQRFAAVICLGAVVRGETPHFDYVAGQCAAGVQEAALSEMVPVIFGVLTTNNEEQAWDRAGGKHGHAGVRAAESALEMIALMWKTRHPE
jgi:6,7-dimethyl-8-ribityllumazine synthase